MPYIISILLVAAALCKRNNRRLPVFEKTLPLLFISTLLNLLAGTGIAGLVCAISGQTVDTVQLSVYTFIGFILGVVILLLLQLVAFLFRDKKMTGVIDLE